MKNICLKTIWNFLVINICALVPMLWMGFGWMPDQVKVYMRGSEMPGNIVSGERALRGEGYGTWKGGKVFRFYLRGNMNWKDLAFTFPGDSGAFAVEKISLQKWKWISLSKSGQGLQRKEGEDSEFFFPNPSFEAIGFADGPLTTALGVIELLFGGLSWYYAKRHHERYWARWWVDVLSIACVLTVLLQVSLPLQSYLSNRTAYSFSLTELTLSIGLRFIWVFAITSMILFLLTRCFGQIALGAVLVFAVCVYLESGILSTGLQSLNGDLWILKNHSRALWDAAAWAVTSVVLMGLHPVLKNRYSIASLCLLAMIAASMLDTKQEKPTHSAHLIVNDFCDLDSVVRNVHYSTNRNVLVFVIDSLTCEQAHSIMEDPQWGKELRAKFQGFTEYTNHVGALTQTILAVPNLLTGSFPDHESDWGDYFWSCYSKTSVLQSFLETGYDVFMTTPALGCGYASTIKGNNAKIGKERSVLDVCGNGGTAWSLREFSRWRWFPFAVKAACSWLTDLSNGDPYPREWNVYPVLARAPMATDSSGTFLWIHTEGVHPPIEWNRHGEILPSPCMGFKACVEQGLFVMRRLAALLEEYRQKRIYDQSLIVVLGDHGSFELNSPKGMLPDNARPFLWVKPVGSTHGFMSSDAPTTHANLADLLRESTQRSLTEVDIQLILQANYRIYRQMPLMGDTWTEWVVERDGTFSVHGYQAPAKKKNQGKPVQCGRLYPLSWKNLEKIDADLLFTPTGVGGFPFLARNNQQITIMFRVPAMEKRYMVKLGLFDAEGGSVRFRSGTTEAEWQEVQVRPYTTVVVRNVSSDTNGMATILCERGAVPHKDVAFVSFLLEEE